MTQTKTPVERVDPTSVESLAAAAARMALSDASPFFVVTLNERAIPWVMALRDLGVPHGDADLIYRESDNVRQWTVFGVDMFIRVAGKMPANPTRLFVDCDFAEDAERLSPFTGRALGAAIKCIRDQGAHVTIFSPNSNRLRGLL